MDVEHQWRGPVDDRALEALHAAAFGHEATEHQWGQQLGHSFGWVTATAADGLVGFVNVAWDGGVHAFIIDTVVLPEVQRMGIGLGLVRLAVEHAREAGCEWLHVDFEANLESFYLDACGFSPTPAGLIQL